jgi:hypothetical protein
MLLGVGLVSLWADRLRVRPDFHRDFNGERSCASAGRGFGVTRRVPSA